jgi:hypothetical protein
MGLFSIQIPFFGLTAPFLTPAAFALAVAHLKFTQ